MQKPYLIIPDRREKWVKEIANLRKEKFAVEVMAKLVSTRQKKLRKRRNRY